MLLVELIAYHSIIPSSFIVDDEVCMFWWGLRLVKINSKFKKRSIGTL